MIAEEDQVDGTDLDSFPGASSLDVLLEKTGKNVIPTTNSVTTESTVWVSFFFSSGA